MSNTIKISNFYVSAFLIAKGYTLHGIERESTNSNRFLFVFNSTTTITETISQFNFAQEDHELIMVDARKMVVAIKKLKEVLYQDKL